MKKPSPKRVLSRAGRVALAFLVLVVIAVGVAHLPVVQREIADLLSRRASTAIGGRVVIGELDYRLWLGEVVARDITAESDSVLPDWSLTTRVDRVVVRFGRPFAFVIGVESPDVTLRSLGGPSQASGPEDDDSAEPLEPELPDWLQALETSDGRLRVEWDGDAVELAPINLDLAESPGGYRGSLDVGGGTMVFQDARFILERAEVVASRDEDRTRVPEAIVEIDGARAEAEGSLESLQPLTSRFEVDLFVEAQLLGRLPAVPTMSGHVSSRLALSFGTADPVVSGDLEARDLSVGKLGPVGVETGLRIQDDVLALTSLHIEGYRGTVDGTAELGLSPGGRQSFDLDLASVSLEPLLEDIAGDPLVAASLQGSVGARLVDWDPRTLDGEAKVTFVPDTPRGGGRLPRVSGSIAASAERGAGELRTDQLNIGGATVSLDGAVSGDGFRAGFRLADLDVATFKDVLPDAIASRIGGRLGFEGNASGETLELQAIAIASRVLPSSSLEIGDRIFDVRGEAALRRGRLDLTGVGLESREGAGRLDASGWLELESRRVNLTLAGEGIQVPHFDPWSATVSRVDGSVSGSLPRPSGRVDLDLVDLAYGDRDLPPLSVLARSDGDSVSGTVSSEGNEFLTAELELRAPYPLSARMELEPAPLSGALSFLTGDDDTPSRLAASGLVTANLELATPSKVSFRGDVQSLDARLRGVDLRVAGPFTFEGDSSGATVEELSLTDTSERTDLLVDGTVVWSGEARHDLTVDGVFALQQLEPLLDVPGLAGDLEVDLSLEGRRSDPSLSGHATLQGGSLTAGGMELDDVELSLEARGDRVAIEGLRARLLDGTFLADGEIMLRADGDGGEAPRGRLRVEARDLELAPVMGIDDLDQLSVVIAASMELDVAGLDLRTLEGTGEISKLVGRFEGGHFETEPADFHLREGRLELLPLRLDGERFDLVTEADITLSPELQWSVSARGDVNLALANAFLQDVGTAGSVELNLTASNRPDGDVVRLDGNAGVSGGSVTLQEPPLAVTDIGARIELSGRRIELEQLRGRLGGGTLQANGFYDLSPSADDPQRLRIEVSASDLRLEYPEGLKSATSADLVFRSLPEREGRYLLSGDIRLQEALYDRNITVERELLALLSREAQVVQGRPSFTETINLDLHVENEGDLRVRNNLANASISADLDVGGTLAAPEIRGTIGTQTGGTVTFAGRTYELDVGRVTLDGYPLTPPIVDVSAHTNVGGTAIELQASGRTDELSTNLRAPDDPTLSRADIASLLVTGRTLEQARGEEAEALGEGLANYLGGSLAGLTERGLGQALPVTSVSVQPQLVGRETDPGARFSLGQAVTDEIFLTYSIGLNSAEDQLWIVDYALPWRLKARGTRDGDNEYSGSLSQELFFGRTRNEPEEAAAEPPRVEVSRLEGDLPLPLETLTEELRLEAGDRFDYWDARRGADAIRARLRENGFLNAQVDVRTIPPELAGHARVEVVYEVEAGRPVTLSFSGDDPGSDVRDQIRAGWDGLLPAPVLAAELAEEAKWLLRSDRYYTAEVSSDVEESEDRVVVTFHFDKGQRGEMNVRFDGNEALPDQELLSALPSRNSARFHEQLFAEPEQLRERLRLIYTARGYADAEIGHPEITFSDPSSGPKVDVVFPVDEGQAQQVTSLRFEGVTSLDESQIRESLALREGDRFGLDLYLQARRTLHSMYRQEGFPEASVRGEIRRTDDGIAVGFFVDEGPRVRIGDVIIQGVEEGKEASIRNELRFSSGQPLQLSELVTSERRLYDLERFQYVDVRAASAENLERADTTRNVIVEVREKPAVIVDYGLRYSTAEDLEGSVDVAFPGLLGSSRRLQFTAFANTRDQVLRLNLYSPRFFGRDIDSTFFVSRKDEETSASDSRTWSLTYQQGRQLGSDMRAQWSYSFRRVHTVGNVMSGPFAFDVTTKRSILSASLIQDTRNDLSRPSAGRFWNGTIQFAPEELGSDLRFLKGFGQLFFFKALAEGLVWASSYRVGLATGFDQVLSEQDRFQAGGPNSVRGFELDQLGPPDPRIGARIGGEGLLVLNQELRFPLWKWFRGVAFLDAGNIYLDVSNFDPTDLRESAGLGVRVDLPVGLLRLDWAYVLDRRPGDDSYRFHFSFGHAF